MVEVRCDRCGHKWNTESELMFVTCPSCLKKVKNPNFKKKEVQPDGVDEGEN